ncbi:MAG TPA: type II secretion system F family protein [Candidatus Eisenbacteria bacterium]|nr:type II secretion system F family protein [Candidatus Eisenbacteria bacterium]
MGEFVCRVADANGRVFSHVEAAASVEEARQKMTDRGLYIYSVQSRNSLLSGLLGFRKERKIGGNDFLILNQQFNTLIKAGLPILKALDLLATRATAPKLRPVLTQIRDRVREGKSLSEAVDEAGVFSKVYSTAILAGEKSGNLSGVLEYYIAYQKVSTGVKKKIVASLAYPALLVIVAICIVSYLVTAVVPKFATLYRDLGVPLPGPTRMLLTITVDYRNYILGAFAVFLLAVVATFFWSRSEEGGVVVDRAVFKLPLLGDTLLKFQASQFCRTLATLLTGGTPLVAALQTASESITSRLVRGSVNRATQMVKEGDSLHGALSTGKIMPVLALDMIEVGESSGALAPMLNSVAEFYEDEVSLRLGALVSLIEPVILIFMGLLVAFILISLYLPIFSFSVNGNTGGS